MNSKHNIFYGWWIILGCMIIMALGYAPLVSCSSLFIKPITDDLGFSRSSYTLCITILSLMCMVMAPLTGKLMSSKNMRVSHIICVASISILYGLNSMATSIYHFYIISFFLGIFAFGATMMPVSILTTNWFYEKRGFALSLAMSGSTIGGALLSPIIAKSIISYGWRLTYVFLGITMFVIMVPITILLIRQNPSDKGLEAYGFNSNTSDNKSNLKEWNISLKEVRKLTVFKTFLVGITIMTFCSGIITHIPPYIQDCGYSSTTAASIVSIYLGIAVFGKIILGYTFDKYGSKFGLLFGNITFILSIVSLFFIKSQPMLYIMALLYGFGTCIGTVTPTVLTSKIFGARYYGEIYGFVSLFTCIGSAFGTPVIASIFDFTGSYSAAWFILIILSIIMTIALVYSIKKGNTYITESSSDI